MYHLSDYKCEETTGTTSVSDPQFPHRLNEDPDPVPVIYLKADPYSGSRLFHHNGSYNFTILLSLHQPSKDRLHINLLLLLILCGLLTKSSVFHNIVISVLDPIQILNSSGVFQGRIFFM
jgi:hypothetical protein